MSSQPFGVALTLSATAIEAFAQVCLKKAAQRDSRAWRALGLFLFAVEALVYTWALRFLQVSTAFPLGSLSFVLVALLSRRLLNERVDRARWTGVLLILAGASLVAAKA